MNTRRYPRTMVEAFGPYADGPIEVPRQPFSDWDGVLIVVGIAMFIGYLLAAFWGLL